nr:phage receptor [Pseudomonas insulae]
MLAALLLAGVGQALPAEAPLSDFQRFRSYPFLERAYREAKQDNWGEVERLMRHLLDQVPDNHEARRLLIQALARQGRYEDALAASAALPDGPEARRSLLELRLAWLEQGAPAQAQVQGWLAHSQGGERVRLWQAYSQSLGKRQGARAALDWLAALEPRGDERELRQALANWAERAGAWPQVIAQLAPLATAQQLDGGDWQRLAQAYLHTEDDQALHQLLAQAPSPALAQRLREQAAQRAIASGRTEQAQAWLQALPPAQQETQRETLWELARQTGNSARVRELANQLGRPCLETAEWLSRRAAQAALEQLRECRAADDPQAWLVLAERLEAEDLLLSQTLPVPWDNRRRDALLGLWQRRGQSERALAWLSRQPPSNAVVKQRAELLQAAGRSEAAAGEWLRYYRASGDLRALDQASFLALAGGRREQAQQLLEDAYDRRHGRLPAPLLARLGGLYAQPATALPPQRVAPLLDQVDAATRAQLLGRLAEAGHCDLVRGNAGAQPREVGQWRALGRCAMPDRPGEAVVYYRQAQQAGDPSVGPALAYALAAAGEPEQAWPIWRAQPLATLDDSARLAASRAALSAGDHDAAERYWQLAQRRSADDWALGAQIAAARGDAQLALQRQREALRQAPDAGHYYAAAASAERAGERAQSTAWLAEAVRLAPNDPRFRADYGMRLAGAADQAERHRAIPYLQQASRDFPEDYRIAETLAWRYDEAEDSAVARRELERAIDLEQQPVLDDDEESLEARRFRQRRAHQVLSQRDNLTLASVWSPAGIATYSVPVSATQTGEQRRASSQNVQIAIWDHALGEEPTRNGSSLSVYGRVLAGNAGRKRYTQYIGTGVGLRYKPFGQLNLNLYGEIYKQNQDPTEGNPDEVFPGLRLHKIGTPKKFERYVRERDRYAQTSTDYLLRATASFLDQGDYRNDWRVDEEQWNERFLYLDAAWWTKAGDHQWLSRFQQGHVWKLPVDSPQTLMAYGFGEFATQDPDNDWRQDLRSGVGLRWQYWYGDDRYNAYRAHVTLRTEYQLGLGGNLFEQANGWLVGLEVNF